MVARQHGGIRRARAAPGRDRRRPARGPRRRRRVRPGTRRAGRDRLRRRRRHQRGGPRAAPAGGARRPDAPPSAPRRPAGRAGRARSAGRRDSSTSSAAASTARRSTTTRSPRSCAPATIRTSVAAAWEASKQVGAEVADRVQELARLRNRAAHHLGGRDHFALSLATSELDEARLFATLDEVDRATAAPFADVEGDARRGPRRPVRVRGRRAAPVALRRPVLPGAAGRGRGRASIRGWTRPTSTPSPRAPTTGSASTSAASWTAATCCRGRARASTRSASTSTTRATSAS